MLTKSKTENATKRKLCLVEKEKIRVVNRSGRIERNYRYYIKTPNNFQKNQSGYGFGKLHKSVQGSWFQISSRCGGECLA